VVGPDFTACGLCIESQATQQSPQKGPTLMTEG
jgi:hypothetical protein